MEEKASPADLSTEDIEDDDIWMDLPVTRKSFRLNP